MTLRTAPIATLTIMAGIAYLISFLTPERDVKVVAPVKFRPRYATIGGKSNKKTRLSLKVKERKPCKTKTQRTPINQPLMTKDLKGRTGRDNWKRTDPKKMVPRKPIIYLCKSAVIKPLSRKLKITANSTIKGINFKEGISSM